MASTGEGFGPQLAGQFDFTLLFEQTILSLLPNALFCSAFAIRLAQLRQRPRKVVAGYLLWLKLVRLRVHAAHSTDQR
jgi:ATP-binding cassette, subfamily C (CFTR/MRP), member 1